jgi:Putative zinc-finger
MQHLDEGTIHAWIDGELPPDEASRVESHAKSCAACGAMVAEARGLVAASSRIVAALDILPQAQRGVTPHGVPAFGARKAPRRWAMSRVTTTIAATLGLAAGVVLFFRGKIEEPPRSIHTVVLTRDTTLAVPLAKAASPTAPTTQTARTTSIAASPRPVDHVESRKSVATRGNQTRDAIAAVVTASAPASPIAQVSPAMPARSAAPMTAMGVGGQPRAPAAMAAAGGAAASGLAEAKTAASRKSMAIGASPTQLMEVVVTGPSGPSYAGCYEVDQSTDVLPRRFALRADSARAGVAGMYEVRYIDSTGAIDGRMVDAGWMEISGRAVIRTARSGEILAITRTGSAIGAESPLGPRTVRQTSCRAP